MVSSEVNEIYGGFLVIHLKNHMGQYSPNWYVSRDKMSTESKDNLVPKATVFRARLCSDEKYFTE